MIQFTIFDPSPPYVRHSPTSKQAATDILPKQGTLRHRVYEFLEKSRVYGATDEEMQRCLEMPANTQRPRRRELQQQGLIRDSGRTRATESGRQAVVWVAI